MSDLAARIQTEIDEVDRQMETQKRALRRAMGDQKATEAVEAELKALHTRCAQLKRNLEKEVGV